MAWCPETRRHWQIQQRVPGSTRFRTIEIRASSVEALTVWSRVVGRIRGGESGRRGQVRLVKPGGEIVEVVECRQDRNTSSSSSSATFAG